MFCKKKIYLFTYDKLASNYNMLIAAKNEAEAVKKFNKHHQHYGSIDSLKNIHVKEYKGEY